MPKSLKYWEDLLKKTLESKMSLAQRVGQPVGELTHIAPLKPLKKPAVWAKTAASGLGAGCLFGGRWSRVKRYYRRPRRGYLGPVGLVPTWLLAYRREMHSWAVYMSERRALLKKIRKLNHTIAHCEARIAARKNRTSWDRVKNGSKEVF